MLSNSFIFYLKDVFFNPNKIQLDKRNLKFPFLVKEYILFFLFILITSIASVLILVLFSIGKENLSVRHDLLVSVLIAPFFEEIIFRGIIRFNKVTVGFFLISIITFILNKFNVIGEDFFNFIIVVELILFFILSFIFSSFVEDEYPISFKYKIIIIYFLSFLFGSLHIIGFDSTVIFTFPVLFFALMKTLNGFAFSTIRLKYGLLVSFIFHVLANLSTYLLVNIETFLK